MELLNPEYSKSPLKFCTGETKSKLVQVRGKTFLYDGNSMNVFEVDDEAEAAQIELSTDTPQFPFQDYHRSPYPLNPNPPISRPAHSSARPDESP